MTKKSISSKESLQVTTDIWMYLGSHPWGDHSLPWYMGEAGSELPGLSWSESAFYYSWATGMQHGQEPICPRNRGEGKLDDLHLSWEPEDPTALLTVTIFHHLWKMRMESGMQGALHCDRSYTSQNVEIFNLEIKAPGKSHTLSSKTHTHLTAETEAAQRLCLFLATI